MVSDSFRLMPWIELDYLELILDRFSSKEVQNVLQIGSETNSRMPWNSSDFLGINFNPILSPGYLVSFE